MSLRSRIFCEGIIQKLLHLCPVSRITTRKLINIRSCY